MRYSKWLALAIGAALTTSCGENSTEATAGTDSSTVSTTTPQMEDNTSVAVPETIRADFQSKYPTATNVSWRKYEPVHTLEWDWTGWPVLDTGDYAVSYTWDGTQYWAWYDDNNNWIGTVSTVTDHVSLPAAVNKAVQDAFPGYTIESIDRENDKDRTAYEIELNKGEDKAKMLIAEDGKVLKKSAVTDGEKSKEKAI